MTSLNLEQSTGIVFNIQRYSIQDGPGIRTTVFLKGCPLNCQWCSNPESQLAQPEIMLHRTLCDLCSKCIDLCPKNALSILNKKLHIDRSLCNACGDCLNICTRKAFSIEGTPMTVDEVIDEVRRDNAFYRSSGGGITISGGEPLIQSDFVASLLEESRRFGIHTCLDTSGYGTLQNVRKIMPNLDMVLFDLKHMNSNVHHQITGVSNNQILKNAQLFDTGVKEIIIRIPLIPEKNTSDENLALSAEFAATLKNVSRIDILPYHRYGEGKYTALGHEYQLKGLKPPSQKEIKHYKKVIESCGIPCRVEG
ncbi:glycyl-radical enzyme activating protein [Chloroflexota bacterium]